MYSGTFKKLWVQDHSYGFITPDNDSGDVFFHHEDSGGDDAFSGVSAGDKVIYDVEKTWRSKKQRYKWKAVNLSGPTVGAGGGGSGGASGKSRGKGGGKGAEEEEEESEEKEEAEKEQEAENLAVPPAKRRKTSSWATALMDEQAEKEEDHQQKIHIRTHRLTEKVKEQEESCKRRKTLLRRLPCMPLERQREELDKEDAVSKLERRGDEEADRVFEEAMLRELADEEEPSQKTNVTCSSGLQILLVYDKISRGNPTIVPMLTWARNSPNVVLGPQGQSRCPVVPESFLSLPKPKFPSRQPLSRRGSLQ